MPIVKIPASRLREHYIGKFGYPPDPFRDMMRVFGERMQFRGFRMVKNAKGILMPDPPVQTTRDESFITFTQDVPGRVSDKSSTLRSYLDRIRSGDTAAVSLLYGYLLENGDDRAAMFDVIGASSPEGMTVEVSEDFGQSTEAIGGRPVPHSVIVNREICVGILRLFGRFDPTEGM